MHTRHSTSNEYRDAVVELGEKLRELGYIVHKQRIRVGAGFSYNLIADRRGSDAGSRGQVVVTAHLDSINGEDVASAAAPGADDNASGSAGILEMARVFSGTTAKRDLRFVLFGGEEQGLFGSKHLVGKLTTAERNRIHAVINMDMIASTSTPERTVLLEGAAVSSNAMDELEAAAVTYTSLRIERSLHASSSDHVPFIEWGIPGVLTIEGADSTNPRVHTVRDRPEHLDLELAVEIVRMNVAFVAATIGVSATAGPEQRLPACARAWPVRDARAALRE
jgi:Zn-dependent M28 family amino/carboxypeptidase